MTATRDRQSDLDEEPAEPAWDERPIVGTSRGLPWWGAVLLAFGLAAAAAAFDMQRQDSLGRVYQGAYVLGCVVAVCWVRRRNLFGPMVQPPLVFAVTAIGAVALSESGPVFSGLRQLIFSVALPLTSNFPTMAITTAVTVAIGLLRLFLQRNPTRARPVRRREPVDGVDQPRDARTRRPVRGGQGEQRQRRPNERQPGRATGRARTDLDQPPAGRARPDIDQPPANRAAEPNARQRRADRPARSDPRDQPPRRGRTRSEPPGGADRSPRPDRARRQPNPRGDQDRRRTNEPGQDPPPRRRPRRPPDSDYR